ncbi:MAG: imidazole glycerol phosphate synthase subunit HisH [Rhodobacteraceae bacterium]|nr:imidazole glycerol phosphate synthase subunit HisH [Paracoccaceae bacterium]
MIAVIDSCGSNITSVLFALQRLGADATLTSSPEVIKKAERVILPGVGAAGTAMERLKEQDLTHCITSLTQPVLGICVGMQLLFTHSEEGNANLLDIIPGKIRHFTPEKDKTIPHMGWNSITFGNKHPLVKDLPENSYFYFVHSYYPQVSQYTIGKCSYGDTFSAIIAKDNFMGCQFHPERSSKTGALILRNFLEMSA